MCLCLPVGLWGCQWQTPDPQAPQPQGEGKAAVNLGRLERQPAKGGVWAPTSGPLEVGSTSLP